MSYTKPTTQYLRKTNRSEILRKIYFEAPITRLEISRQIGVSPATVTNIVGELLEQGILVETGLMSSEGGRPSTLLEVNPQHGYFIGIEVGETFVKGELFDIRFRQINSNCTLLAEAKIEPDQVVALVEQAIEDLVRQAGITAREVIGAGIGFPGLVDPAQGVSIFTPNWGWHDVSLTGLLKEKLNLPLYLDNGAKAMAISEMLFDREHAGTLAVLLVGTGVGGGIIAGRKLLRGASNNAGEFGHTTLDIDGPLCRCGSRGCLESYVGANGVIQRYRRLAPQDASLPADDQTAALQQIVERAEAGEPAATQTLRETLRYLGAGLANLINAYNPDQLLLGGWLGMLLGSRYLPEILEQVSAYALQQSFSKARLELCRLGHQAVAMGAAALVLEHFFENAGKAEALVVGGRAPGTRHPEYNRIL